MNTTMQLNRIDNLCEQIDAVNRYRQGDEVVLVHKRHVPELYNHPLAKMPADSVCYLGVPIWYYASNTQFFKMVEELKQQNYRMIIVFDSDLSPRHFNNEN